MANVRVEANIQNRREVNATRIKDVLYIFNGTYPLYYKGDGKLYLFPEHQTTYTEAVVSGHNTMMSDFEGSYYPLKEDLSLETFSEVNSDDVLTVRDYKFTPRLPFTENVTSGGTLSLIASVSIPSSRFSSGTDRLKVTAFYRASVPGSTEADYIEVPVQSFQFLNLQGGAPLGASLTLNSTNQSNVPDIYFDADLRGIPTGLKDIYFEFEIVDSSGNSLEPRYVAKIEFPEITISLTKIEDYPTEEEPERGGFRLRAPWTANQVMEHYGQLLAWGSLSMPSTLFISNNQDLSYFPYLYTFTFENDLNEKINAITPFMNILVVQSDSYTWGLKGSNPVQFLDAFGQTPNPNAYQPFSINKSVGCIAPKSVRPVRNRLYFLSQEGLMELTSLFATDDRYNVKPLDRNIRNLIPQDREAVAIQFDNQYWVSFPSTGELFRYYVDKQAWVRDTFNFDEFNGFYRFYNKDGNLHMLTHPMRIEDEGNFRIYETIVDKSLATDLGQPVKTQFLTSKMNQDYPFHWKRYKELKLDFTVQNEYMPNKAPITLKSESSEIVSDNVVTTFSSDQLLPFHSYTIAYNENVDPEEEDEVVVNNGNLLGEFKDRMIRFTLTKDVPLSITVSFPANDLTEAEIEDFTVVDDTYNTGLNYNLRVMADNNTMIRDDFKSYVPIEKTIDTGTSFSNITFGNTNFGDVTTFVQTTKLYGNGYDINVYYKDESNIKWTLETMGVTYKMRRTRSDRRGG